MKQKLLLVFIMMAPWMFVSCTPTGTGCYGYWEKKRDGLQRGTRALNKDAHLPYYQCVDENNKGSNLEKIKQYD